MLTVAKRREIPVITHVSIYEILKCLARDAVHVHVHVHVVALYQKRFNVVISCTCFIVVAFCNLIVVKYLRPRTCWTSKTPSH